MKKIYAFAIITLFTALLTSTCLADLEPAMKAKAEAKLKELQAWGTDAKFVDAVKAANATKSADAAAMTQDKWKSLTLLDPFVRSFSKNALGEYLKTLKSDSISSIFVSAADGTKVAFLSKTTNWSHKGQDKHEKPMAGQTWIGQVEVNAAVGVEQVQISFPVLDGGKPIGSVVVGIPADKLR